MNLQGHTMGPEDDAREISWALDNGGDVLTFLDTHRPTAPSATPHERRSDPPAIPDGVLTDVQDLMDSTIATLVAVDSDDTIPLRRTPGVKEKHAQREEVKTEAVTALKQIMLDNSLLSGHWVSHAEVDKIWRTIALSAVNGPLSKTAITRVQVECCDGTAAPHEHLVQLHMPNIFEKAPVRNVLLVLLERHGIEPTGVKPDLYTAAGIDSSHPSRIRTTIWRPRELIAGGHTAIQSLLGARRISEAELVEAGQHPTYIRPNSRRATDQSIGNGALPPVHQNNAPPTPPETPRRGPMGTANEPEMQSPPIIIEADASDMRLNSGPPAEGARAPFARRTQRPLPVRVTLDDNDAEGYEKFVIGRMGKRNSADHDMAEWTDLYAPRQRQAPTVLIKKIDRDAWSMGIAYLDSPGY